MNHDWMLEAPMVKLTESAVTAFEVTWTQKNVALLPGGVPRWLFLQWLTRQGYLLHGSQKGDLEVLVGQDREYGQPDEFSNTVGVYAASDGLWAMMYALRGPQVAQQSDMALQLLENGSWSRLRYFLSVAPKQPGITEARALLAPGFVYVLSQEGFTPSPAYQHGGLGFVQEAHWVNPQPVKPLFAVPVTPDDFPLPVRLHDAAQVTARAKSDPWGFPWLGTERQTG